MDKNSWKMRCVDDGGYSYVYTVGKVYEVKNGMVSFDDGFTYGGYKSFKHWKSFDGGKWELVEDEMTIQEKIKKTENKIAKWQSKLDTLKQQEQAEQEEKLLTGWEKPKEGNKIYNINGNGECVETSCFYSSEYNKKCADSLNAFSKKEKAQEIANAQLAYRMARRFADTWEGETDGKMWEVYYNKQSKNMGVVGTEIMISMNEVFPSRECAKAFIDQHGKEYAKLLGCELN